MRSKIVKGFLGIIMLVISPFIVLAIVGIIFILFQLTKGASFTAGVHSFINIIYSLVPYFSYLTVIPVLVVIVTLLVKYRQKLLDRFNWH